MEDPPPPPIGSKCSSPIRVKPSKLELELGDERCLVLAGDPISEDELPLSETE